MDPAMLAAMMTRMGVAADDLQAFQCHREMPTLTGPSITCSRPPQFRPNMSSDELCQYADKYRAWFEEDLKIAPGPAPFMNRTLLVSEQAASRRYHETRKENGSYWTYTGLAKHYCSTSLLNLERITFSNMSIRKTHIGRFLLCRIITPCMRLVAISTVVEDTDGLVQNLSMYNFPTTIGCSLDHLDKLFPIGTVIAIREPTLKAPLSGPRPLVRVDSPTDIVFIEPHDPILRDITWRTSAKVKFSFELLFVT